MTAPPRTWLFSIASALVLACGGPAPLNVSGKLLTVRKQPVGGVAIVISGKPAVNTDADGAFAVAAVTPPYDLMIVDSARRFVMVYKGLTRADPTLLHNQFLSNHSATVSGAVTAGGLYPQPALHRTNVAFVSPEIGALGSTDTAGAYSFAFNWYGPSSSSGSLHALQVRDSSPGIPAEYKGYGRKDFTLSDGAALTAQNISIGRLNSSTVTGSATAPADYVVSFKSLSVAFGAAPLLVAAFDGSSVPSFNFIAPNIANTTLVLDVSARKGGAATIQVTKARLPAEATGINIALPQPAEPLLPAEAARGVQERTTFSWSAFAGGVHLISFNPGTAGNPSYLVLTSGTSATIPDGSPIGLGLPGAAAYSWIVQGVAGFSSVDAAASSAFLDALMRNPPTDFAVSTSSSRSFTTAP